jgi:hypothetical protein
MVGELYGPELVHVDEIDFPLDLNDLALRLLPHPEAFELRELELRGAERGFDSF